jgi:hypothetical protein
MSQRKRKQNPEAAKFLERERGRSKKITPDTGTRYGHALGIKVKELDDFDFDYESTEEKEEEEENDWGNKLIREDVDPDDHAMEYASMKLPDAANPNGYPLTMRQMNYGYFPENPPGPPSVESLPPSIEEQLFADQVRYNIKQDGHGGKRKTNKKRKSRSKKSSKKKLSRKQHKGNRK